MSSNAFDSFRKKLQDKRDKGDAAGGDAAAEKSAGAPPPAAPKPPMPKPTAPMPLASKPPELKAPALKLPAQKPAEPKAPDPNLAAAKPTAPAGDTESDGGSALDRMKAARAKLNALKGGKDDQPPATPGQLPAKPASPASPLSAARQALERRGDAARRGEAPRRSDAGKEGGGSAKPGASAASPRIGPPDRRGADRRGKDRRGPDRMDQGDFESFARNKKNSSQNDAKRRAFEEGVEVQELDKSRMSHDRATRLSAEEIGDVKQDNVIRAQFASEDVAAMANSKMAEIDESIPEGFDSGRATRKQIDEIEAESGPIQRPARLKSHRSKKKSAKEIAAEIDRPEGLTSHRHQKVEKTEEDTAADKKRVKGYQRFEF